MRKCDACQQQQQQHKKQNIQKWNSHFAINSKRCCKYMIVCVCVYAMVGFVRQNSWLRMFFCGIKENINLIHYKVLDEYSYIILYCSLELRALLCRALCALSPTYSTIQFIRFGIVFAEHQQYSVELSKTKIFLYLSYSSHFHLHPLVGLSSNGSILHIR